MRFRIDFLNRQGLFDPLHKITLLTNYITLQKICLRLNKNSSYNLFRTLDPLFDYLILVPRSQNKDNFIDKAFTVIAESIVKVMPIAAKEKQAYIYYRNGLSAQNDGDYSEALEYYEESLKLEDNAIDRGETLKNMAIIYMSNGEEDRALDTYIKALDENPKQPSCLKNMGLIYEKRGRIAQREGKEDESDIWFDRTADVWSKAVRLYPGGYLDIENWLKTSGRSNIDVYL